MSDNTITDEQAQAMRDQLAAYEQQKAFEAAERRHQVYLAIKPLVESEEFILVHEQITALRENGPKDDSFFGIGLDAVYHGMTGLGVNVANWQAPVSPNTPVPLPPAPVPVPPAPEGDVDGE